MNGARAGVGKQPATCGSYSFLPAGHDKVFDLQL